MAVEKTVVPRGGLASALLFSAVLARVVAELSPLILLSALSGFALVAYVALLFGRLGRVPRLYLVVSLGIAIWVFLYGTYHRDLVVKAINNSGFLVFLLVAAGLLRKAAETSELVRQCGAAIINQPPGRRYLVLALGGNFFGFFLSVGALNVLCTMARNSIYSDGPFEMGSDREKFAAIRLRRTGLAIVRGFSSTALWSPLSIPIALILANNPVLGWPDLVGAGAATATTFFLFGWTLDNVQNRGYPRRHLSNQLSGTETLALFSRLIALVMLSPVLGFFVSDLADTSFIFGVLMCMAPISLLWFIAQNVSGKNGITVRTATRTFVRTAGGALVDMRTEVTIFVCAGFLAVLLVPQIDAEKLGELIISAGLTSGMVLVVICWTIFILSFLGLNVVFQIAFTGELLRVMPGLEIDPRFSVIALTATFAVIIGFAPLSIPIRLAASCLGKSGWDVGVNWNWAYSMIAMGLITAMLLLAG